MWACASLLASGGVLAAVLVRPVPRAPALPPAEQQRWHCAVTDAQLPAGRAAARQPAGFGKRLMRLRAVWGVEFGMCIDEFGVTWMVNITQLRT